MSGIGHYTADLVRGLRACGRGDRELVLLGGGAELQDLAGSAPDCRMKPLPALSALWEQLSLPSWLADHAIALYHNPAFGLPIVKPCPFVATVHDCIPRLLPQYCPPWLCEFFVQWAPTWLRLADHLICDSWHTAHDLRHLYGFPPERMTVVYQAVNPALQPGADELQLTRVRGKLGIDAPYVLTVGRVELRKNAAGLLQALRLLRDEFPELLLVWAGPRNTDAYDPEGALPVTGRQGPVVVTGYVTEAELAALYTGAEVFCFPSFYEGFGRPVLEAMQCGAPVVTSRVSSLPEVGGEACLYVNPYDPAEIAAALCRALTDSELRASLVRAGLTRAAEFTAVRQGRETWAVYDRVLAGVA